MWQQKGTNMIQSGMTTQANKRKYNLRSGLVQRKLLVESKLLNKSGWDFFSYCFKNVIVVMPRLIGSIAKQVFEFTKKRSASHSTDYDQYV